MSQYEVLTLLMDEPDRWFTPDEVIKLVGRSESSVNNSLRTLKNYGELEVKYDFDCPRRYGLKRRRKVYYRVDPAYYRAYKEDVEGLIDEL